MDASIADGSGGCDHADGDLRNAMGKLGVQFNEHWRASFGFIWASNNVNYPGDSRVASPAITPEYKSRTSMATGVVNSRFTITTAKAICTTPPHGAPSFSVSA